MTEVNKIHMVEDVSNFTPLETMEELYTVDAPVIKDDEEADNDNDRVLKRSQLYWKDYLRDKDYNKDINKMCELCIKEQKETYGKVVINCKGLADARTELGSDIVDHYEEVLPPEEFRKVLSLYDPYAFMEEFLDVENRGKEDRRFAKRWYQEMVIRCLHEDTFIHMSDGSYKPIKCIEVGDSVYSFNKSSKRVRTNKVTNKWFSGEKEVFRLSLSNDSILEVTKEHPILKKSGEYESLESGLKIGDMVYTYSSKVTLTEILSIESIGTHKTYDIEVDKDHNFIANSIIVHNCTAQEKNIRMGRRCIPHYEKVLTEDGYRPISSLKVGDMVKSFNSENQKFRYSPVTKVINNGLKMVYRLTLKNGKKVECTENHPLLVKTPKGKIWQTLETGLFIGARVCFNKRNKVFTSELVDIERVGEVLTYDISVGKDATFLVDDIITHNTGKSFALSLLIIHRAVMAKTTSNYRILIVSPFAAQTEEVVDNIISICRLLVDDPIKSSKGSPNHEVVFKTGCILKGFTASKEANSIRGQPGDLLVIDEADDMPIKAMVSIMGIRMGRPNVEVWKSGTPKGEKNLFAGDLKPAAKSFHYPSFVIPHYTDALDEDNRADLGEIGYVQEVMAEYGAVANGVYQSDFLRRAQERAVFTTAKDVLTHRNNYIVITGVDWNGDGVGVRIITVAFNKFSPDFKIIDRQEVSLIGRTQEEAVDTLIKVNRKFNVDHIYCDVGYGHAQIENLKTFGERAYAVTPKGHPDRKLVKVVGVEFGGVTEIKDHRTGTVHKVPTKQFAVQNSVILLEKDLISLHEKEDHVMLLQMKNYIEKSRSRGRIVYTTISKKIGDHDLDAFIFALYGFKIEYPALFGEQSLQAMMRFGGNVPTTLDHIIDDVPFVSLSFGRSQNATISRTQRIAKGSNPVRSTRIGAIRRRDSFR